VKSAVISEAGKGTFGQAPSTLLQPISTYLSVVESSSVSFVSAVGTPIVQSCRGETTSLNVSSDEL